MVVEFIPYLRVSHRTCPECGYLYSSYELVCATYSKCWNCGKGLVKDFLPWPTLLVGRSIRLERERAMLVKMRGAKRALEQSVDEGGPS